MNVNDSDKGLEKKAWRVVAKRSRLMFPKSFADVHICV